jgi:hypothetical protein
MAASISGSSGSGSGGGILYALVARGSVVLAEHAAVSGNSSVVAVGLLGKVPQDEGFRASWAAGQHAFHILSTGGLTYLCMAEQVTAEVQVRASPGNASLRRVRALFCFVSKPCACQVLPCIGLSPPLPAKGDASACLPACPHTACRPSASDCPLPSSPTRGSSLSSDTRRRSRRGLWRMSSTLILLQCCGTGFISSTQTPGGLAGRG